MEILQHRVNITMCGTPEISIFHIKIQGEPKNILCTVTENEIIISQKTPTMCHISEERSFYVDYSNITFEMIFVSSHSSEWSKNTSTMQKKSFSTPKMHFWWSFSLVSCSMISYLYILVQKPFIWLLISLQGTIKTIWYGFTNLL